VNIEVRNDNHSRFSAKLIQDFFKENHLNLVFTHPYTPQENGHMESFHANLAKKLPPFKFWSIEELEGVLTLFYEKYNNERLHSSVCNLPTNSFLECWNKELIYFSPLKDRSDILDFKIIPLKYEIQEMEFKREVRNTFLFR